MGMKSQTLRLNEVRFYRFCSGWQIGRDDQTKEESQQNQSTFFCHLQVIWFSQRYRVPPFCGFTPGLALSLFLRLLDLGECRGLGDGL